MYSAEDEPRTKTACPRRRHIEWYLGGGERLQAAPQSLQLGIVDPDPGATGIHQSAVRCVIRQQERPEPRSRSCGICPADNHELLSVQAFNLHPQTEPRDIVHPFVQNPG